MCALMPWTRRRMELLPRTERPLAWMPEEFAAVGVPLTRRGAGFEDHLAAMRACWAPDPVEYDGRRFGYYYTEEVSAFPTVQITEGELFALVVAEKALQQYRGTPFEKPLISAFQKMEASLPDTVSLNFEDWNQTISLRLV